MSVSENSTLLPFARDNEVSYKLLEGDAYGVSDMAEISYEESPYSNPDIIVLEIGADQAKFYAHRAVLSQSHELAKLSTEKTSKSIVLPGVDEIAAHTLVHYLYSGKYQALKAYESGKEGALPGYKLGACVYCAATRYKLPRLAELAKLRIRSLGEDLNMLDVLTVARESVFPGLPDDESWYLAYLEGAIKRAVSEDRELFTKPEYANQIVGNAKLLQLVMKAMVNTYSKGSDVESERQTGLSTPVAEPIIDQTAPTEPSYVKFIEPTEHAEEQFDETALAEEPVTVPDFIKEDAIQPEKVEPIVETPLEPFTDELGFGTSKTYQKLGNIAEKRETENIAKTKLPATDHKRSDSVIQDTDVKLPVSYFAVDEKAIASPEPADASLLVADVVGNSAAVSKKKDKKSRKKKGEK